MHVNDDANQRDSSYWKSTRPVPLTLEEERDYQKRDSMMRIRNSKGFLDSVDRVNNRPKIVDILFSGYSYDRRSEHLGFGVSPLVTSLSYNTVQGMRTGVDLFFNKGYEDNTWYSINPSFSYGFSDTRFYSDLELNYYYKPVRFARITAAGGSTTAQFNAKDPVPVFFNSAYTLLEKQNYLKLYAKNYGSLDWYREIVNGFMLRAGLEYADRMPLYNTSFYYWGTFPERHFTSNDPQNPESLNEAGFERHKALDLNLQMTFRIKQKYYTRPNEKIILGSKYPTLGLQYRRGTPGIFGSKTDYDFLKASIRDEINFGLIGRFSYYVGAVNAVISSRWPITSTWYGWPSGYKNS